MQPAAATLSLGACCLAGFLLASLVHAKDLKSSCSTCKEISENFNKQLEKTAKKNFGGGNTAWEERKLSKYEASEIRLVEILEGLCDSSSFECNHMVEEHEEHFETWWFRRKSRHPDLYKWFCIETIEVCCPKGTFGPDCNGCVGGSERPCHGNGVCDGDGTRGGTGECSCSRGYKGEFCLDCADGFFNRGRNETSSLCAECDKSCRSCAGPSSGDCDGCKEGWQEEEGGGACVDVDECAGDSSPCKEDQYCLNGDGSFSCHACGAACRGCKGAGPDQCLSCADGFTDAAGTCADVNECERPEPPCPDDNHECVNQEGSYQCRCASGHREEGGVCVPVPVAEEDLLESQDARSPAEREDL
ncbi:cysteine-rich with EGF-like domain protein 2 [Denticeps clupeoides]|uniref:cysteine-rich with EGF-like domain protein 2 n=1 Tax=Denticeps clupeoides TaxID=299321 RepID=UPI0010A537CA|nr:cysteine-rich with EGF-like domain protein 2 [Denticeps clupeoides]